MDKKAQAELIPYEIAESLREYLYRTRDLGMLEGPLGAMDIHPEIKKIVSAMHHVLAGGKVELDVVEQGNPDVVAELDARWDHSISPSPSPAPDQQGD